VTVDDIRVGNGPLAKPGREVSICDSCGSGSGADGVFWGMMPCRLVYSCPCFGMVYGLHWPRPRR
jgi:hypothetical protein